MVAEIETIDDIVCMRIALGNCEEKASLGTLNLDFVARYYRSPTSHWPSLSASEAQLLLAGLKIVAVWELASTTPRIFLAPLRRKRLDGRLSSGADDWSARRKRRLLCGKL